MQGLFKISKTRLLALLAFFLYALSIAIGSTHYLPVQTHAPGIFSSYSFGASDFFFLILIALAGTIFLPKNITQPSDWFIIFFAVFLFIPGLTLITTTNNTSLQNKLTLALTLIACVAMVSAIKNVKIIQPRNNNGGKIGRHVLHFTAFTWVTLFCLLTVKYQDVMRFSGVEEIYDQRELTSAARSLWGYGQLYFTFVCSTLLIAYGFDVDKLKWIAIGSSGYFIMYLITAERSQLLFPIFFSAINHLSKRNTNPIRSIALAIMLFAVIIFGTAFFHEDINFFDLAGFYLFTRLIATPAQFILDYYDFFSMYGYTFFSQIRGFDLFIDAPGFYSSNEKWPQLGWIVGADVHGIKSNSNASFLAADGAASLGAIGMLLVTAMLCIYLIIINGLSRKFSKTFWSIIFAQQAFILTNGSLFSLFLSFGGFIYLLIFIFFKPKQKQC